MSSHRTAHSGFSLVEVVIAMGVTIVFLVGVFCLMSVGLNNSKQASDDTTVSLILQDVANRIRGTVDFAVTDPAKPISPFYYDNKGRFLDQTVSTNVDQNVYVAKANVGAIYRPVTGPNDPLGKSDLLAVTIKLYSPVNKNDPVPAGTVPKVVFSYYVTRSTGNGWKQIDPTFTPKIEM